MHRKPKPARPAVKQKPGRNDKKARHSRPLRAKRPSAPGRAAVRARRGAQKRPSPLRTLPKKPRANKLPPPRQAVAASPDAASIQAALDLLAKAQAEMTARGVDLLAVAHELGRNAVQALKASLLESLVEDQLLPDLKRLHFHLGSAAATPPDFQFLAEATLNWFARHFDLSEHLEAGQLLEVPAKQLDQFELDGAAPESGTALVRIQVLAPGWKCRTQIIIPPRVARVDLVAESATKTTGAPPSQNPF